MEVGTAVEEYRREGIPKVFQRYSNTVIPKQLSELY